ncbi:uncharacterized protein [Littorina saxatilis]|uniref:uncharacterized protein n=1 Tax=Littorina saxatilis TaxID=31220 RepID=UPI0038B4316B
MYDVYITTGSSDHAGNDYIVYLEMSGSNGSTGRLSMNSAIGTNNPFEKGRLDRFSFETVDVGVITSVTVSYQDPRGLDDRWFLERVDIKKSEPPSEAVHTFIFYAWLDNHQFYSKCEYQQAKYQTEGNSVSEFECGHTQHCQDPAHAAIITSTQELTDVTRCVCQGDVSGFFARLMIDNDTELTPASDENCEDTPSCEFQNTRICIRNEQWSRVNCRTRCGYCASGWMPLEDTEHMFKFVNESDVNVTECEARCDAHSVRVVEVGCFGANQYEKHVLCETGEDDSHLLECHVTTTALGVDTTTDGSARTTPDKPTASGLTSEALESPTAGTIAAEATSEATAAVTSTTSQPATTTTDATTSEPVTTTQATTSTEPTTTSSSDAATTTSHNPTTTTVETTTTSTTTWKSTAAETTPESAHQTTTAEVSSSDRDACRAMCDSFSTKNTPESTTDADTARSTSKAATSEIPGFFKTGGRSTGTSSLDKTPTDATNSTTETTKKSNWYTALCNIISPEQPENMTRAEFLEVLAEQVRKELAVNVSSLSKTRAKKISAPDHRKSSQTAGYMAVGFLVTFFVLMMLLDLNRVYDGLRGRQEVGTQDRPEAHEVGSEKAPLSDLSSP